MTQPSLLQILDRIDTTTQVTRIPGVDAPCICDTGRKDACCFPFCEWPEHLPEREAA